MPNLKVSETYLLYKFCITKKIPIQKIYTIHYVLFISSSYPLKKNINNIIYFLFEKLVDSISLIFNAPIYEIYVTTSLNTPHDW